MGQRSMFAKHAARCFPWSKRMYVHIRCTINVEYDDPISRTLKVLSKVLLRSYSARNDTCLCTISQ